MLRRYKVAFFKKVYNSTEYYCACDGRTLILSDDLGLRMSEEGPDDAI